jgi:OmcA/MtrC family decaheme c-type cytochrome
VKIDIAGDIVPTQVAHRMATIYAETPKYVYILGTPTYTATTGVLSVPYSVTYTAAVQDLTATTTDWSQTTSGASRLAINLGWKGKGEADYTNVGNGSLTTPASALSFDGLKVGTPAAPKSQTVSGVTATISGDTSTSFVYTLKVTLPSAIQAMGTGIVFMDGHPAQNLGGTAVDRIPVLNVYKEFAIKDSSASKRRAPVVAVANCKNCHTVLSLHGNNRTDEPVVCTVCHNTANTDIARRPAAGGADGLAEQAIDFKFLIHRIHAGRDTTAGGITVYGFGGSKNVFAGEFPPGNRLNNCENCHATAPLTYKGPMPYQLPLVTGIFGTTISTSKTVTDPSDDLNISPQAALCSGCHDNGIAKTHIQVMGGAFGVLQKDINY